MRQNQINLAKKVWKKSISFRRNISYGFNKRFNLATFKKSHYSCKYWFAVSNFYNLVDTYFAGRISPEALAAIAKSWPIYFIAIAVAVGVGAGTTALISNSIGKRR